MCCRDKIAEEFKTFSYLYYFIFAFYKSKLGYNPVDIDIVTYILSNILHIVLEES